MRRPLKKELKVHFVLRKNHVHQALLRRSLRWIPRLRIDVNSNARTPMTHQPLNSFYIFSVGNQRRCLRVSECVLGEAQEYVTSMQERLNISDSSLINNIANHPVDDPGGGHMAVPL